MWERQRFENELADLELFGTKTAGSTAASTTKLKREMKFEIQTHCHIFVQKKDGTRIPLKRKAGVDGYLVVQPDAAGAPLMELQAEAGSVVEFETPSWSHTWCEAKERMQAAVDMVDAMTKGAVIDTGTRVRLKDTKADPYDGHPVRYVEFPFDVQRLVKGGFLNKGEKLVVEIPENSAGTPVWDAKIQASESFELKQFESYLAEHHPKIAKRVGLRAKLILSNANSSRTAKTENLYNLLSIIVLYIMGIRVATKRNEKNGVYKKGGHIPLAKEHIPLMSRTNFNWMYRQFLTSDERALFKTIVDKDWVLYEWSYTRKEPLYPRKYKGRVQPSPTIYEWLQSIHSPKKTKTGHRDVLSWMQGDNRAMGRFPEENLAIKDEDKRLVKFEARATSHKPNRLSSSWMAFADEVFKDAAKNRGKTLKYNPKKCP